MRHPYLTGLGELGGFREDLIGALAIPLGRPKAEKAVSDFELLIKARAEDGAKKVVIKGIAVNAAVLAGVLLLFRRK